MLLKQIDLEAFDYHGLSIRDFGPALNGAASVAVIRVPEQGEHPFSYSSACDKVYYVLEGRLQFSVDGVIYRADRGDVVIVPKGAIFQYYDAWDRPSRLLLFHLPAFDPAAEHVLPDLLRVHAVHLQGERVTLRPMTEEDWPHVLAWNADPEVLVWSDGTDEVRPEEDTKSIYRGVSLFALVFVIEMEGEPIGECWLQKMNLPEMIALFPGQDLRRLDIMIGRKDLWGHGLGSDAIRTLADFGLEQERADAIFAMVSARNPRSQRAFLRAGFEFLPLAATEECRPLVRRTMGS